MKIANHRLTGDSVKYKESPNHSGTLNPDTIVVHYTAGRDAESSVRTLVDPDAKASAHLVVGRKGEIFQLVPFNVIAWNAGRSAYQGRVGFNKYSIGIEIDNAGPLTKNGDNYTSWFGRNYPESEVFYGIHRNQTAPKYWHRYSEEQILIVEDLCRVLIKTYPGISQILGHEEIAPQRKTDPGPAFPLDKLRSNILFSSREEDAEPALEFPAAGVVSASKLNIRSSASGAGEKVANPLPRNSKVTVLEEKNGWYRVRTEIEGWVSANFVDIEN